MRGLFLMALALTVAVPSAGVAAPTAPQTRIVFTAAQAWDRDWYDWQVYSALPSGQALAQLTFGEVPAVNPLPSPDGRLILFMRMRHPSEYPPISGELWVMKPDGRAQRRLVAHGVAPSWAPDSRRIAYGAGGDIRTIGLDGKRSRVLVRDAALPAWSPDGRGLAFVRRSGSPGVYVVVRWAGRERVLSKEAGVDRIAWSPDGRWIAFVGYGTGDEPGLLKIIRPDGSGLRYFRTGGQPTWSPDGQLLALQGAGLHVLNMATGVRRRIVDGSRFGAFTLRSFAWSPAGNEIVYSMGYGNEPSGHIEVVPLTGRVRRVQIAHAAGIGATVAWTRVPSGLRFRPPLPLSSTVGEELRLRKPIRSLAADGGRVAYSVCNSIGVWRPGTSEIVPVRTQSVLCGDYEYLFLGGVALAGERVAWASLQGGMGKSGWLTVAPIAPNAPQTVVSAPRPRTSGDPRGDARSGYLMGDGPLLVFSEWAFCGEAGTPCVPVKVFDPRVSLQSLWRVREPSWPETCTLAVSGPPHGLPVGRCQTLRTEPGPLVPLDANEGRIVVSGDNATLILDDEGRETLSIPAPREAAQLAGDDLVVLVSGQLRLYDASTGALVRAWNETSGLQDVARGLAAYVLDGRLHVLRLEDGADTVVGEATVARFGDTGLFYAYEGPYPWRGRIRFVPFESFPFGGGSRAR